MRLRLCGYPGCSAVSSGYYCPRHQSQAEKKRQKHTKERAFVGAQHHSELYKTARWRAFRRAILARFPACQRCGTQEGKLHLHHIKPARDNPELFYDEGNILVLCESCHAVETQREIEQRRRSRLSSR